MRTKIDDIFIIFDIIAYLVILCFCVDWQKMTEKLIVAVIVLSAVLFVVAFKYFKQPTRSVT